MPCFLQRLPLAILLFFVFNCTRTMQNDHTRHREIGINTLKAALAPYGPTGDPRQAFKIYRSLRKFAPAPEPLGLAKEVTYWPSK